ncbi:leucine-rich repeat-containing 70, partial [Brachionus plicatilis]
GCHLTKIKPVFEIVRDTDREDLKNAVYYLNIGHIVKELENSMVLQIEKKFEKKNTDLKFDIDLFLSCLSEDIQEIAIEEFAKMSKSNCDDIFKKFEKWMKQIYKNTLNDNLNTIQKILDIGFDFPSSDIHLNNIYLESKSEFCFIFYYNDKLRRARRENWEDALECMADLKKKNENYGHYILCNLELHDEVDDVDDMCIRMFYEGKEKKLMFFNEDFIEFHKVNVGDTEISFNDRILTYYIEDEIFTRFRELKKIEFKNGSLSVLSENCLTGLADVEHIDFQGNKIRSIEDRSFADLTSLEHLNLSENRIDHVTDATFEGLNALEFLNLERNAIRTLGESVFASLKNLTILDISDNRITSIECSCFEGLENVEYLDLRSNLINSIEPGSLAGMKNLKKLLLNYNKLSSVESGLFDGVNCLKKLDLSKNLIKKIDDDAFDPLLEELEYINIGNNKIDESVLDKYDFKNLKEKNYDSKRDE